MFQRLKTMFTRKSGWSLASPGDELLALFGAAPTAAGIAVTTETALRVPAVACAVRQIAESVASLPVIVKRVLPGGEAEPIPDHPISVLLNADWNGWTSAYEGKLAIGIDALCHDAGGIAWVNRIEGTPREIIPYRAGTISVTYADTGEPSYTLSSTSGQRPIDPADVIHIRALGTRSRCPLSFAREAIGIAITQERYAANLFAKGGRPSGTISVAGKLSKDASERIRASWQAAHAGEESGKTAVLEEGAKFEPSSFSSVDMQFLELQKFGIEQVARSFKVPPHMLYELGRATWSNTEQMGLEFLSYTIQPWLEVWQGALRRALFSPDERAKYRIEFDTDDLTRADIGSRATAYSSLIASRVLNPNEARRWEGLPPYEGGNEFINPAITPGAPADTGAQP